MSLAPVDQVLDDYIRKTYTKISRAGVKNCTVSTAKIKVNMAPRMSTQFVENRLLAARLWASIPPA